jgi:glycine oxidase
VKVDYLIVGQGIAGSVLALTLHNQGKKVMVLSKDNLSSSSAVAAGVYNPFNFRRSIPTWEARTACPVARAFYSSAETLLGAKFHSAKKIIRVFGNAEEQQRWNDYLNGDDPVFAAAETIRPELAGAMQAPFGYGILTGGGVVNTGAFLYAVREFFLSLNQYRDEVFHAELLQVSDGGVMYDNRIHATQVVFCEGHLAARNPLFAHFPVAPSKGEVLHVEIPGLNLTDVINGPVYLAPLGHDLYICGATYNPGAHDEVITGKAREELSAKLSSMLRLPFRIVSQFAGVRPAGRDRKPVIGRSVIQPELAVFNGMGSKGVLMSPWLAQQLVNHLENGAELQKEISVQRFKHPV